MFTLASELVATHTQKQHWSEMLYSYWSTCSAHSTFSCSHRKSSSSENRLFLNETKQGQGELVDHNVLFSEMLREIRTCEMGLYAILLILTYETGVFMRQFQWYHWKASSVVSNDITHLMCDKPYGHPVILTSDSYLENPTHKEIKNGNIKYFIILEKLMLGLNFDVMYSE